MLLTPPGSNFRGSPQRVLVAWNGSREATRAVREALPLLRRARLTRLVVVDAEDPDGAVEDASAPLARHLGAPSASPSRPNTPTAAAATSR